ncbi:hypothetical protein Syun_031617 [Stephania yunnanensis]|uniref:Myosin motor domain-containing protein n=1 Tax=Stephania yunnanensis TaxID=152371 RepID=A0AAP0HBH9_9MAGN
MAVGKSALNFRRRYESHAFGWQSWFIPFIIVLTMPMGTVLPANPNILEDTDDLVQLSFLNEPSVLHNLCCRYSQSKIYTKAGPVLLVMNPFKGAEVRGNELVAGREKKPRVSSGIYSWAKDAFIAMMNERLNLKTAREYNYLKQGECLTIGDVDDAQQFHVLMEALDDLQIHKDYQDNAFAVLSAILWLGNISFRVVDDKNHVEVVTDEAVTSAAKLMGCNVQDLISVLSTYRTQAGNDNIVQKSTLPKEYAKDGIDCKKVHFEDNQECVNLIERPEGLLALFDEETGSPKATDLTFVDKLKRHFFVNPCFKGKGPGAFTIRHYAGEVSFAKAVLKNHNLVLYTTNGFLEKNRDTFHSDSLHLLSSCTCQLLKSFVSNVSKQSGAPANSLYFNHVSDSQKRSISSNFKKIAPQDALVTSIAILQRFNIHPDMYQVGYTKLFFRIGQLAALDEAKTRILNRILLLQKLFRGYQARSRAQDLKCKISRLQSFIRGWLVRKNSRLQRLEKANLGRPNANRSPTKISSEHKYLRQEHAQEQSPIVVELQKQIQKTESTLMKKEGENVELQQQVKELELRWSEYEAKMKSMEETWKRQMTSLQASLVAARKGPTSETGHPGRPDASPMSHYNDYDDTTSMGTQSPGGSTPGRLLTRASDAAPGRDISGNLSTVNPLTKEFEHQKHAFENDARFLVEVKSRTTDSTTNPMDELQELKLRFYTWKKDYKVKLRDARSKLHKLGFSESDKTWKWWGKRNTKKG